MSEYSDRFALPLLAPGQAQKEITHNEALTLMDILLNASVESMALTAPPLAPVRGQCWIIAADATGDWAGKESQLAAWTSGGWRFVAPREAMRVSVADIDARFIYASGEWVGEPAQADGYYISGKQIIGERQGTIAEPSGGAVIDIEARAVLSLLLSAVRSHGLIELS